MANNQYNSQCVSQNITYFQYTTHILTYIRVSPSGGGTGGDPPHYPKNNLSIGGLRLQVPLSSSQPAQLLPKNALLFSRIVFLFSRSALLFSRSSFFSKMLYCFQELLFSFQKCFFICFACFFPRMLFSADCTFSYSCSELLGEIIFALLLFYFLLKLFIDHLDALHLACVHIQTRNKLQSE